MCKTRGNFIMKYIFQKFEIRIMHESIISKINHLTDSAKFEMSAINILCKGMILWSF